jgi:hypothetical protein
MAQYSPTMPNAERCSKDNLRVADDPGSHRLDDIRALIAVGHRIEILIARLQQSESDLEVSPVPV